MIAIQRSRKTLQQTNIAVTFQFSTDKEQELILALQLITTLVMIFWNVAQALSRFALQIANLVTDIMDLSNFIRKVITIHINAYAFGLGVRL